MGIKRMPRWVLASSVAVALGGGAAAWWVVTGREGSAAPGVEPSALAAIDEYLPTVAGRGALGARWFCSREVIEGRQDGAGLRVGLDVSCAEYARRGAALVQGSGGHYPMVVTLEGTPGRYRVSGAAQCPDGDAGRRWVKQNFSQAGGEKVLGRQGQWGSPDDPADEARRALGLTADAPVLTR